MDKASDETINKKYAEYKQRELNEKVEKTRKALGKHELIYILPAFLDDLKSRMLKNYTRALKTIQSSKIKWLAEAVFSCVSLVIIWRLYQLLRIQPTA